MKQDEIFAQLNQNRRKSDAMDIIRRLEAVIEVATLAVIFYFIWLYGYEEAPFPGYLGKGKYVLAGVYGALLYLMCIIMNGFQFGMMKFSDTVFSQIIGMIIANLIEYAILSLIANVMVSFLPILLLSVFEIFAIAVICYVYHNIYLRTHMPRRLLVIYGRRNGRRLDEKMSRRPDKYRIAKVISADVGFSEIIKEIVEYDGVVLNDITAKVRNDIMKFCYSRGIRVYAEMKISDIIIRGGEVIDIFDTPLVLIRSRGITAGERLIKRLLDILFTLIVLVPALPIMAMIAVAIKIDDHGPVFYRQERITEGGRKFMILKFRSMVVNAEQEGEVLPAADHDARITRVGRFIRSCRFDELPQLFNILKGEMSFVGPRPERTEHVEKYLEEIPEFVYRYKVPAGLTGYAQIIGQYNTSAYDKLRLDTMYIEHYSLWLDIKLVLMTIRILFMRESTAGFEITNEEKQGDKESSQNWRK